MNKQSRILVVGSMNMDIIVTTKQFPADGETILGTDFSTASGGKGANQAVQAAKLGAIVDIIGRVGKDLYGQTLLQSVKDAGVSVEYLQTDEATSTAVANIQIETDVDGKSENRIIVVPGANMTLTRDSLAYLKKKISVYDMVILQMEIPMEVNEVVIDMATEAGVPVLLNPAPAMSIKDDALHKLTYIVPNETEAAILTGIVIRGTDGKIDFEAAEKAAKLLLDQGAQNVIITLGDAGAICATRDGLEYCPSIENVTAIDPTAAGDSFIGAFAVARTSGMPNLEAIQFACKAAAITVSRKGAQPSLPTRHELEKYYNR